MAQIALLLQNLQDCESEKAVQVLTCHVMDWICEKRQPWQIVYDIFPIIGSNQSLQFKGTGVERPFYIGY